MSEVPEGAESSQIAGTGSGRIPEIERWLDLEPSSIRSRMPRFLRIHCLVQVFVIALLATVATSSGADSLRTLPAPVASDTSEMFVVYATLRPPLEINGAKVLEELANKGIHADLRTENLLEMFMNRAQIRRWFRTRVEMRSVPASSRPGMVREPYLVRPVVPERWRRYLDQVVLDNQL